jgi:hypothetical protein
MVKGLRFRLNARKGLGSSVLSFRVYGFIFSCWEVLAFGGVRELRG